MPTTFVRPDGLPVVDLYHPVALSSGTQVVFVAGQVSWDEDGELVGRDDLAAQVEQCYLNLARALDAVGGGLDEVVDVTVYVVDWAPEKMPELADGLQRAWTALGVSAKPPATLIGVAALDVPEHLVEVKATAVLG